MCVCASSAGWAHIEDAHTHTHTHSLSHVHAQAVARVHRIGQTRETVVTRLLIDGTIEGEVLRLLQRKQQLFVEQRLHHHAHPHQGSVPEGAAPGGDGAGGSRTATVRGGEGEGAQHAVDGAHTRPLPPPQSRGPAADANADGGAQHSEVDVDVVGGVVAEGEVDDADADEVIVALAANVPRHETLNDAEALSLLDAIM